jgi:PAS domain S-box-containing protein
MEARGGRPSGRSAALRDLTWILLAVLAFVVLGSLTHLFDHVYRLVSEPLQGQVGESLAALLFLSLGLALFALLQGRAGRRETDAREQAESRFRALVEKMPAVIYTWDPRLPAGTTATPYVSPQVEQILGFTAEEWTADPELWIRQIHPDDRDRVIEASNHADRTGEPFAVEYRHLKKDGSVIWVRDESVVIERDHDGRPCLAQGVMYDVTERKRAEHELGQAEERYRTLVEQLPVVVYQDAIDEVSTALYISPQYERVFGFAPDARLRDPNFWIDHLHPGDRDRILELSNWTNETGEPFSAEYRFIGREGRVVWVRDEAELLRDADGKPLMWQGVLIDVTARKHAEDALVRRDEVMQAIGFAAARFLKTDDWGAALPDVLERLGTASGAGRVYVFENVRLPDRRTGMRLHRQWFAPGLEPAAGGSAQVVAYEDGFTRWEEVLSTGAELHGLARDLPDAEREHLAAEGVLAQIVVPVFVGDEWWGFLGFDDFHDERVWPLAEVEALKAAADTLGSAIGRARIEHQRVEERAERRHAEHQLREAEQRYRTLVENLPAATYIDLVDDVSTTLYISPQVEAIWGYTPAEWATDPDLWIGALHPGDRDRVLDAVRRHNLGEPFEEEYRFRAKDGRWTWVGDHATVVRDETGTIAFSQGAMFDVTERRQAEEQLREAEERYRAIVEHVPAAIYVDVPDGSMQTRYVSPQIEQIMGCTPAEFIAQPNLWLDLIPDEELRAEMRETYLDAIRERRPGWSGEYLIRRPDGREVWVHDETTFVTDERGEPLFLQGVMYDVTERKHAEQALRESEQRERDAAERLREMDEMKNTFLAAVSHELRSPLTSILGLSLTLERQTLSASDQSDLLGRLAMNARKLDRLLKDLLDIDRLSRGIVTPKCRTADLSAIVRRTVESLDVLGERSILVRADPVVLFVDPPKIERIVENLVMNAVRHTPPEVAIWVSLWPQDGGAVIAVEDDGPGVPHAIRGEIFEPFRQGPTASAHSPGTGIGLSLVAMFAELHGGRAWVEDREGGGASFRVFLPGDGAEDEPPEGGRRISRSDVASEAAA